MEMQIPDAPCQTEYRPAGRCHDILTSLQLLYNKTHVCVLRRAETIHLTHKMNTEFQGLYIFGMLVSNIYTEPVMRQRKKKMVYVPH